jgi:hypothetical protein
MLRLFLFILLGQPSRIVFRQTPEELHTSNREKCERRITATKNIYPVIADRVFPLLSIPRLQEERKTLPEMIPMSVISRFCR